MHVFVVELMLPCLEKFFDPDNISSSELIHCRIAVPTYPIHEQS